MVADGPFCDIPLTPKSPSRNLPDDVDAHVVEQFGDRFRHVMVAPGLCSPSRRVVEYQHFVLTDHSFKM
jgi:hypothetical protein